MHLYKKKLFPAEKDLINLFFSILDAMHGNRWKITRGNIVHPLVYIPTSSRIYIRKPGDELQTGIILKSAPAKDSAFVSFVSHNGHLLAAQLETVRGQHDFEVKTYDMYIQREDDLGLIARLEPPHPENLNNPVMTHFHLISPKYDYDLVGALEQTPTSPSWASSHH